jgi:ATP-dependent exoDNAse (exonuclease V) alpha subunit
MLLRNLDPVHGLCNGTRMTILRASTRCLEVRLNGGTFDGETRLIYRTKLTSNEGDFHFQLTRLQFPVRLAFAMTINKSQGQSLTHVGIDLQAPVFTHGQLYVALSRATDVRNISILIKESNVDEVTDNIVYPEALQALER